MIKLGLPLAGEAMTYATELGIFIGCHLRPNITQYIDS